MRNRHPRRSRSRVPARPALPDRRIPTGGRGRAGGEGRECEAKGGLLSFRVDTVHRSQGDTHVHVEAWWAVPDKIPPVHVGPQQPSRCLGVRSGPDLPHGHQSGSAAGAVTRVFIRAAEPATRTACPGARAASAPATRRASRRAAARCAGRSRRRSRGTPAPSSVTEQPELGPRRHAPRRSALSGRSRAGRRWTAPRAAPASSCSRTGRGTTDVDRAGGAHHGREARAPGRTPTTASDLGAQRPVVPVLQLEDRAPDVADGEVEVLDGLLEPLRDRRAGRADIGGRPAAAGRSRRAAGSRRSCRSRAIRSRSETTRQLLAVRDRLRPGPAPSAAWSANETEQLALLESRGTRRALEQRRPGSRRWRPGGRAAGPATARQRLRGAAPAGRPGSPTRRASRATRSSTAVHPRRPRRRRPAATATVPPWSAELDHRGGQRARDRPGASRRDPAQGPLQLDRRLQRVGELGGRPPATAAGAR